MVRPVFPQKEGNIDGLSYVVQHEHGIHAHRVALPALTGTPIALHSQPSLARPSRCTPSPHWHAHRVALPALTGTPVAHATTTGVRQAR